MDLATAVDMITPGIAMLACNATAAGGLPPLGYRRAGGPGRLYPAIQAVRAMATAIWIASAAHGSTRQEPAQAELHPGWIIDTHAARVGRLMAVAQEALWPGPWCPTVDQ